MTDRELMQQALEALITAEAGLADIGDADREPGDDLAWCEARAAQALAAPRQAIAALRERLAQPVQEPVGWLYPEGLAALKAGKCWTAYGTKQDDNNVPIYDAVAPRVEPRASESGAGFESLPASPDKQPEQEPVAWMFEDDEDNGHKTFRQTPPSPEAAAYLAKWNRPAWVPLYTAPPQRKPLTDEDLRKLADKHLFYQPEGYEVSGVFTLARAIEAAHGIVSPSSQDRNP